MQYKALRFNLSLECYLFVYFPNCKILSFCHKHICLISDYEMNDLYEEEQIQKLYECISNCYNPNFSDIVVSHDHLIPKLRPYQSQAVKWMIEQENPTNKQVGDLHVLYEKIDLPDGQVLYFHKYGG